MKSTPALLAIATLLLTPTLAQANDFSLNNDLNQVTSVSQLSDVQPTDWAFTSLQSLVERYGCIAGYPDRTFRGNRALTRYEFAAGLNACLDRVNELIGSAAANAVKREDLDALSRLQTEFSKELTTLRGRVDDLERRTDTLAKQQFSTNVKLNGITTVGIQGRTGSDVDSFPVDGTPDTRDESNQINMIYSTNLSLTGALSPKTRFTIGLQAGKGSTAPSLSQDVALSYEGNTDGQLRISDLAIQHLITPKLAVTVGAEGISPVTVFRGPDRFESAATGSIGRLTQRNANLNSPGGAGIGLDWQAAPWLSFQGVYASNSSSASNPTAKNGLFNGQYTLGAQAIISPSRNLDLSFHYLNTYSPNGNLGLGVGENQITPNGEAIKTDLYGASASLRLSPKVTLGGWAGFTTSRIPGEEGRAKTSHWMAYANFPDLFGAGNLGGLYVGQSPRITSSNFAPGLNIPNLLEGGNGDSGGQKRASTHVEAFWRWQLNDRLSITPGVIAVFNQGNAGSDTTYIGALRTSFSF
jgi:hypothetical protein